MDGLWWKTLLKWMIWGYHYFWKHPVEHTTFQVFFHPSINTQRDDLPLTICIFLVFQLLPGVMLSRHDSTTLGENTTVLSWQKRPCLSSEMAKHIGTWTLFVGMCVYLAKLKHSPTKIFLRNKEMFRNISYLLQITHFQTKRSRH